MNKLSSSTNPQELSSSSEVIRKVLLVSMALLAVFALGGFIWAGASCACSVLIGGLLVNGSFWLLKTDVQRLMHRIGAQQGVSGAERLRFFLKFYARLVVFALLLFVLASKVAINVIGLTLGLTTIMFSVVIIGLRSERGCTPSKV